MQCAQIEGVEIASFLILELKKHKGSVIKLLIFFVFSGIMIAKSEQDRKNSAKI